MAIFNGYVQLPEGNNTAMWHRDPLFCFRFHWNPEKHVLRKFRSLFGQEGPSKEGPFVLLTSSRDQAGVLFLF